VSKFVKFEYRVRKKRGRWLAEYRDPDYHRAVWKSCYKDFDYGEWDRTYWLKRSAINACHAHAEERLEFWKDENDPEILNLGKLP
jgi:hypothetical protein